MRRPPLSEADHIAQGKHNEMLLDMLIEHVLPLYPQAFDWALIVMFYAALHYASACLLRDTGECPEQHTSFYDKQTQTRVLGMADSVSRTYGTAVAPSYFVLYDRGWEARYRGLYVTQTRAQDALDLIAAHRKHLETIKKAKKE
jgi:hypothetical protein